MPEVIRANFLNKEYKFHHPFSMMLSGSSGTGKVDFLNFSFPNILIQTTFIYNLLKYNKSTKKPTKIIYCYPAELPAPPIKVNVFSA